MFKRTSREQLLSTWSNAIGKYKEHVASLTDDVLDNGGEVTGRGRMTVYEFVKSAPVHTREHGETIRRAIG